MANILKIWDEASQSYVGIPAIRGDVGPAGEQGIDGKPGVVVSTTPPEVSEGVAHPVWINPNGEASSAGASSLDLYPVGSLYWSSVSTSPAQLFGGTWEQIKDQFILAAGDSYAVGETGGQAEVTLTVEQMPSHQHYERAQGSLAIQNNTGGITPGPVLSYTWTTTASSFEFTHFEGGGAAHTNMPPYKAYYCWERIE